MPVPVVEFTDERLPNGLRLIVAEDHLAPVVAVNIWYNVGSKHEVPGKTGFAHLFEHVMFQGSAHVGKAEHMALVQAAGGTLNGTTWLDRTNYYETMPSHQLELAIYLEADRMGSLLDALSQENLDNQREVVKNEKRWSYDNRPYGTWNEKLLGHLYPEEPSVPPPDDRLDGGPRRGVARRRQGRSSARTTRPTTPCSRSWATAIARRSGRGRTSTSARSRPTTPCRRSRTSRCRRSSARSGARPSRTACRCRASTSGSVPRSSGIAGSTRSTSPRSSSPGGKGSRLHKRLVREERLAQDVAVFTLPFVGGASINVGWATVRPGVDIAAAEAAYLEELERLASEPPSEDELERAKALTEADELGALARVEERADRLSMYATLFDDPGFINTLLPRYLSVTAEQIRDAARGGLPRRQPGGPDLRPGRRPPAPRRRVRRGGGMSATELVAERPVPGQPRAYDFPTTVRTTLANGLRVIVTPMPGRALIAASLVLRTGAADEPDGARRRDRPRRAGADRGHGGPRRDRADRGRRAPRRVAPRRGRLGRDVRRARRARRAGSTPALELLAEVAPPAGVPGARGRPPPRRAPDRHPPGEGRSAAPRRGGVRRRDLRARRAPTAGPRAAPRTPSRA